MTSGRAVIYGVRMGDACAVHRHRELVPLNRHHIWPQGQGGPTVDWNLVTLCENAHYSVHSLLDALLRHDGAVPWSTRRRYGRGVRKYAQQGFEAIQRAKSK